MYGANMEQNLEQTANDGAGNAAPDVTPPPSAPAADSSAPVNTQTPTEKIVPQKPLSVRESLNAAVKEETSIS